MQLRDYYEATIWEKLTDKGWLHSYIDQYYSDKFSSLKETPLIMLELGVSRAQSIKLWAEWFENAFIYGIDTNPDSIHRMKDIPRTKGFCADGYNMDMVNKFDDGFFDIIIEDGPHSLESQVFAVKNWSKKLRKNKFMVIEDIQYISHAETLIKEIPHDTNFQFAFRVFDLRHVKNRYDDIILEITRI